MKVLQNSSLIGYVIVLTLSVLPLIGLFHSGLPLTHDGQDHVARIANFFTALSEGHIVPRWAGNLNWGYGHPILMFLYPFSSYLASFFHFLGFSFVVSTKLVFASAYIASGITMYLFIKELYGWKAGIIGSIFYQFAVYRFVDLYVRGAIGEHMAFVFAPLIFFFIVKMTQRFRYSYIFFGSFSFSFLILSHNAISLMFFPLLVLFIFYCFLFYNASYRFLFWSFVIILFGFLLSAFFWLPAFVEGKYTLRDIVTRGEYSTRFETIARFFYSPWNYGITGQFSVEVGIFQWLSIFLAPIVALFAFKKNEKRKSYLIIGLLVLFWLTIFLMLRQSQPIWEIIKTLQKFQFPWRFLSVIVFITAFMCSILFTFISEKHQKYLLMIILFPVLMTFSLWHPKGYLEKPESFYTGIYEGTTDTGESAPVWSVRFMEHVPKKHIEIVGGTGAIYEAQRLSSNHEYLVNANTTLEIVENTLYFPGWEIFVDNKMVPIQFQNPQYRGLMLFHVPKGHHNVLVTFQNTKVRQYAASLSLLGFFVLLCIWGVYKKKIFI